MFGLLSFIGFLLLFATVAFYFTKHQFVKGPIKSDGVTARPVDKQSAPFLQKLAASTRLQFGFGLLAVILAMSTQLWFWAYQGNQYYLVYPTGGWGTVSTTGPHWRGFAAIQEWQKEIDIKVVSEDESEDGIEGVIRDKTPFTIVKDGARVDTQVPGIHITFIDRVNGALRVSVRMKMPQDPEAFRTVAESFKSQDNLINNTLIPTIREQASNLGYQYAAQDYISGAATDFRQSFDDQLKYGGYATHREEVHDTIYNAIDTKGPRSIREVQTSYKITKILDKNGQLIRIPHEITKNKVDVTQVIVDAVVPEPAFVQKLEAQRDMAAEKRIEMEKIEVEKAKQLRTVAEGEVAKAKERADQEKEQVSKLIAIETELKQEATMRDKAKIALETAELDARKLLTTQKAEAEANRLKVQAGLTPQERAQIEKETRIEVAKALAGPNGIGHNVTTVVGGGEGKSQDGLLSTMLGVKVAESLLAPKTGN